MARLTLAVLAMRLDAIEDDDARQIKALTRRVKALEQRSGTHQDALERIGSKVMELGDVPSARLYRELVNRVEGVEEAERRRRAYVPYLPTPPVSRLRRLYNWLGANLTWIQR